MSGITVRTAAPEDAGQLLSIYAPYVRETAITFEYEVPSEAEFRERIVRTLEHYPYLAALRNDSIVGYAYAGVFKGRAAYDWAVETTIYVAKAERGGGIGRILYEELERRLAEQGIRNLYACIAVPRAENPWVTMDSVRFHSHLGYRPVGTFHQCGYKFNTWFDMMWMEKLLGEHPVPPPPVIWRSHWGE